jgi:adenylate kinase
MQLILLGPPGAGKGTQAQRISSRCAAPALSSGDILREEVKAGSDVGKQARQYMDAGTLVPDAVITEVMLAGISRTDPKTGFVLDGFPRTVGQAEALSDGLRRVGRGSIDLVLNFDMPDRDIVRRIVGRRTCSNCHATYNTEFLPPKVADKCDRCGHVLTQRADDREDVVVTRLATYRSQTEPLVAFYRDQGLLRNVDASAPADRVEEAVGRIIDGVSGAS